MAKMKLKLDNVTVQRIRKVSEVGGYSSPEEFVIHVIERELDTLDPELHRIKRMQPYVS